MCDPVSLSIASTVIGAAGTAAGAMGQRSAQRKQESEVNRWQEKQLQNRRAEGARQEALRQEATAAQQAGLQQVAGDEQSKRQADEETRLAAYLKGDSEASQASAEAGVPTSVADEQTFSGQEFTTDLAKKISEATTGARQRIGALARVSSFGESFGGLGTMNPILQAEAGANIDRANEFRRGSLGAYGVEQNVNPVQVSYTPSPLADIFSTALSVGAQGLGSHFGNPLIGGGKAGGMASKMKYIPPASIPILPQTTTTIPTPRVF